MKLYTVYLKYNRIIPRESSTETRDTFALSSRHSSSLKNLRNASVCRAVYRKRVDQRQAGGWRKIGISIAGGKPSEIDGTRNRSRDRPPLPPGLGRTLQRERARPLFLLADRHRPLVIETAQPKKKREQTNRRAWQQKAGLTLARWNGLGNGRRSGERRQYDGNRKKKKKKKREKGRK